MKKFLTILLAAGLAACTSNVAHATVHTSRPGAAGKTITLEGKIINIVHREPILAIRDAKGVELLDYALNAQGRESAYFGQDRDTVYKGMSAIIKARRTKTGLEAESIRPELAVIPPGVEEVSTVELERLTRTAPGEYALVDVRPANAYAEAHIPTAVSIPFLQLQADKGAALPATLKKSGKTVIFYCDDNTCSLSTKAAAMAVHLGYKKVKVLLDGIDSWRSMGMRQVSGYAFVNTGNIVLVDLRDPAAYKAGHIARAVNVPFATLKEARSRFPARRIASIVLYGGPQADSAVGLFHQWGYNYATEIDKGLQGYVKAGNTLVSGPGKTEISWERKVRRGEVSFANFKKAIGEQGSTMILDVRTPEETAEGTLPHAITIPLSQLSSHMNELKKNKLYYIHCATGTRAQMASFYLNSHGFRTKYLVGFLSVDEDGSYSFNL